MSNRHSAAGEKGANEIDLGNAGVVDALCGIELVDLVILRHPAFLVGLVHSRQILGLERQQVAVVDAVGVL